MSDLSLAIPDPGASACHRGVATCCPVCGGPAEAFLSLPAGPVCRCGQCEHQFFGGSLAKDHVAREYDDHYFTGGGVGYPDYLSEGDIITAHGRAYAERLTPLGVQPLPGAEHLLDVGCAAGFVMRGFAESGWTVHGVDPNAAMVRHARENLGLQAWAGSVEQLAGLPGFAPPEHGYQVIAMIQVIAHLQDPRACLAALSALLAPGGTVLVETWDSQSRSARWFRQGWHEYSPPNVLHYFSAASLDKLMASQGLERVARGRPTKRLNLAHARSLFREKYGQLRWGRLMLAASAWMPAHWYLPYPPEDLFWAAYQRRG